MKYKTVIFDWGDTLCRPDNNKHWDLYEWVPAMVNQLYSKSYRLAIISNTHRYQDGHWIRNQLAKHNILQTFEAIISSATYGIHKPDVRIFDKLVEFMQIDPTKAVMIGDSVHCDGGCQYLGMTYMQVTPQENWLKRLYQLLGDHFPSHRKLSNVYEYRLNGDILVTKLRHLSEPLVPGDQFLIDQTEYAVVEVSQELTKPDILKAKDEFVSIKVIPV